MVAITRRQFLSDMSICGVILATANAGNGLAYISPAFDENSALEEIPRKGFFSYADIKWIPPRICYIGTGKTGLHIGKILRHKDGMYRLPKDIESYQKERIDNLSFNIMQFTPDEKGIMALLSECHLTFLAGSLEDREFWYARDLILNTLNKDTGLLITIVPDNAQLNIMNTHTMPAASETFLSIEQETFIPTAINIVRDTCNMLIFPYHGCIIFEDIIEYCRNTIGGCFTFETSKQNRIKLFDALILKYKYQIDRANNFLLIDSYDCKVSFDIDDFMQDIDNILYSRAIDEDGIELLYGTTMGLRQILNSEFRRTLIFTEKHGSPRISADNDISKRLGFRQIE
ncbi:MAG: hypothetical protein HQK65_00390 [Desulfamplus sp.]|nr:hypothetical protein [Desulfamplus sp.]